MTSRRKIKYHIPGAIALLLGIVAFCMMFVAAAEYSGIGAGILDALGFSSSLTGAQLAFGYAEGDVQVLNFNILATLAYFLPLVGGLLALLFKNGLITKIAIRISILSRARCCSLPSSHIWTSGCLHGERGVQ